MPVIAPLGALKLSTEVNEQANNPLGTDKMRDNKNDGASSPPRSATFTADPSPSKLVLASASSKRDDESSTAQSEDLSEDSSTLKIVKTEHKLFEESEGFEEPLLKENPHRFVLFPIQDNDVSI